MTKILIYLDSQTSLDLSLLGAAQKMVHDQEAQITAIGFPKDIPSGDSVYDQVLILNDLDASPEDTMALTELLTEVQHQHHFDILLFPATPLGRILAPRVAIALHTGLVADVTDLVVHDGFIDMIRPAYSGKLMAQIVSTGQGPLMMTIRPKGFTPVSSDHKSTLIKQLRISTQKDSGIQLLDRHHKASVDDIRDSKILISGGGGILDHFDKLQALATILKAQVSASRRVVDSGRVHRKIQVGQSGKTVSPKLYIALGISGSVQHIEGLKNVETIIAVNTNKQAPICSLAALVVEGDAVDFIEKLITKIEKNSLNFKEETQ
jgi:electron transfer flavoprotein alpha subunit